MKFTIETPKQAIKPFLKQRPSREDINVFKKNLINLLDNIDEAETEEHLKNEITHFLRDTYYKESNFINTKDRKDLVIHLGKTNKDDVGVIIEAKRPKKNEAEMITADSINKKAFHELILYYLDERYKVKNIKLKQLAI